jgi:hypothetical protein
MQQNVQAVGMPWFEEDDYESFKPLLPDRRWHATFAEWEADAEQNLKRLNDQGFRAIKAKVRSTQFVQWCNGTGRNVDTKALTAFGAEAAFRNIQGQH